MFYCLISYAVAFANLWTAGKEKALLYIVAAGIFAIISLASPFLANSKAFHTVLVAFYAFAIGVLIVQHSIYGAHFNDYLLMSVEFAIFIIFSVIELLTPSATSEGVL